MMSTLRKQGITPADRRGLLDEVHDWTAFLGEEAPHSEDAADRWATSVSHWVVDACLLADQDSLRAGLDALRDAYAELPPDQTAPELVGMVSALAEVVQAALDRAEQVVWEQTVDPNTHAARMLVEIAKEPGLTNAMLAGRLGVDPSEISRNGRLLNARGLAFNDRRRHSSWRATPRGESAAERVRSRTERAEPLEEGTVLPGSKDAATRWAHALSQITQLHQEARGGAAFDEGPQRPGLLLIDCKTARFSEVNRLMDSWVEQIKGKRTATHSIVGKDRSEPDHYVEIVEYPSYEEAIRNLQLPETSRMFREIVALCDEKPALVGLDVVRDQQYNKAIIHQYFNEVLNSRNLDLIDELFHPDYQDHDPANKVDAYGPAGVREKVAGYLSAFDLQFRDLEQTADGDDVTTRWTCHGTHTGEYMGFPATQKEVEITGIAIHRIRAGKIAEGWWNWDVLGMLQQLGIVEAAV
ncbi:ester cyclase [Streptomyces collinus]|uniref:Steroid delta-isomerase-like uncharacterized protein n=1 Tax=Streptomyces collinus TaxID=42684 RepID=A0AA89QHN1_STRCU|nr:ester cyclase [Streptomyces collinus]MBB5816921.1 steroid delta-isomerase-like uncharacterized protein [Streptomyces collinus]WMX61851.1 ester cyclase [Streptomyces collinus]